AAMRLRALGFFLSDSERSRGTMSSSSTSRPALAMWAAMPLPMTPDPTTPTRLIGLCIRFFPPFLGGAETIASEDASCKPRDQPERRAARAERSTPAGGPPPAADMEKH